MQGIDAYSDRMRIDRLLRCRKTRRYFNGVNWTADVAQAWRFPSQFDAIRACIEHRLTEVDLVLRTPEGGADLFSTAVR